MMFSHEGPWHKVDRIWTIRTDGSDLKQIHKRTMPMEIAGHEFFGADGKYIYYDLQTPKSVQFLARALRYQNRQNGKISADQTRMVCALQRLARRQSFLRRRRRTEQRGKRRQRAVDVFVHAEKRQIKIGKTGQSGKSRLQFGAERHVYARRQIGCFPLEYVRTDADLRRRSQKSKLMFQVLVLSSNFESSSAIKARRKITMKRT